MKQSFASAAKAPRRRTHSRYGVEPAVRRVTATSDSSATRRDNRMGGPKLLGFLSASLLSGGDADATPAGISPTVTSRHNAMRSLRAKRHDHRRLARAGRTFSSALGTTVPSALSFWNRRKRQASWIKPRRTRALPDLRQPLLAPPGTALIGRAGETGIARHGPSVAQGCGIAPPEPACRPSRCRYQYTWRETHHRVRPVRRAPVPRRSRRACSIAGSVRDHSEPCHVAPQFTSVLGGSGSLLRRPQCVEALRRLAQFGIEAADPQATPGSPSCG